MISANIEIRIRICKNNLKNKNIFQNTKNLKSKIIYFLTKFGNIFMHILLLKIKNIWLILFININISNIIINKFKILLYFINMDPNLDIYIQKLRYPDPDSILTDSRFYYSVSDPNTLDILSSEWIQSKFRIRSESRIISLMPTWRTLLANNKLFRLSTLPIILHINTVL